MSTCRCCGQHIASAETTIAATPTTTRLSVDERVLALCNTAYEDALRRGSAEVEIAHLVLAIAASEDGAASLAANGAHASEIGRSALAWLQEWDQRGVAGTVRTSAELKALLSNAQARADAEGREFARLDDVTFILVRDAEASWSAAFVRTGLQARIEHRVAARETNQRAQESVLYAQAQRREQAVAARPASPQGAAVAATSPPISTQQSLLERDFAWVLARNKPAGTSTTRTSLQANPPESRGRVDVRSVQPTESGVTQDRSRAGQTAARARDVIAVAAWEPRSETSPTADDAQPNLMRQIAVRLENQERVFSQRLDMQQRMLTELAETFARSLREVTRVRESQTAAVSSATSAAQAAGSETGAGTAQETSASSNASRRARSGSQYARFRRHSWNAWQRSRSGWGVRGLRALPEDQGEWSRERTPWAPSNVQGARITRSERPEIETPAEMGETEGNDAREKRFYLALDDEIEKAPAIGPRTAGQLNSAGIMTVRDLLLCDPAVVASKMSVRYITAERIAQWQAQSRLVCTVPWLRGTHAQLLTGAGYDTIEKIVAADTSALCAAILKFAATRDGQSVLRASPAPGMDWVEKRLQHARLAEPERAAA